jgi:hypothetical protein
MKVLAVLVNLTDAELCRLEETALERRNGPATDDAERVLTAIKEERGRRKENARLAHAEAFAHIRENVSNLVLEKRIEAAFTDLPPTEWERAALMALEDNPGGTTEDLSAALGHSEKYLNWFSHLCRDREAWLGPARSRLDGKIEYSTLLVDFAETFDPSSEHAVSQWRLKPEAASALRRLRIIQ